MKLLTIKQVAEILSVNYYTVYDWVYAGHIEYVRVGPTGRNIRITEQSLQKYIENNTKKVVNLS